MTTLELPSPSQGGGGSFGEPSQSISPSSSKLRNSMQDAMQASKLYRELSPTRVYAGAKSQIYTSLPDLFRKSGLPSLRPSQTLQYDSLEGESGRVPKMLDRLESLLEEKLKLVDTLGASSNGFASKQLRTDAYRQAFDAFINSFTTYRTLLLRVKREYDLALDDALASLYDNYNLHAQLDNSEQRMDQEIEAARAAALKNASVMRQELQDQYNQQEQTALEAEARCQAAELEIQRRKARVVALRQEAEDLEKANRAVKYQMLADSGFKTDGLLAKYAEQ